MLIKYYKLFETQEWKSVRKEILKRDKTCVICGDSKNLQVHHRQYSDPIEDKFYNKDYLVTICKTCHDVITNYQRCERYKAKDYWPYSSVDINKHICVCKSSEDVNWYV